MRKVNAILLYRINEKNKYNCVLFYASTKEQNIITFINNSHDSAKAYNYECIHDLLVDMENILRENDMYVKPYILNSVSKCHGIQCIQVYDDIPVANPTRFFVRR